MKVPKVTNRHCKHCGKHTEHKVTIAKRKGRSASHPLSKGGTPRVRARGLRRGAGNLGRYSKPTKPKMSGKKLSKKTDFRYECAVCKKTTSQASGTRAKKVELV
ncbi:50S ribosomal protein L44e [Candidatus Woesearchaeota archaeon]|nr:50S ribosomal protein L44e [Candidatus Woesearchaeota archaeon]